MAPNNKEKGGLSHSAQKKANAEAKKPGKTKGPSGDKKQQQEVQCPICKTVVKKVVDMKAHFESKHSKETFDPSKHAVPV
jgi:hypothetical protein|mmetsp:Transcript_31820/g.56957  ORF Transcript_31820/g.56957 Transcript_31820/m.56957 type:complete len:80 (+) Transcript_31820:214-453(+)|eukprot:CAMPEP_0177756444 /NCGR_PEP_ID=MMETSP0491_2-20121128/3109_1 /TAXON_ID=63592 /ORGANISM="Tetraselmis chuii, Strain PLY429" /LENGTH=79 /DNA_ID=CAMNT_0019272021 /DNA_START=206 /DNA_END=445 /DNA_ORIENTATION=-